MTPKALKWALVPVSVACIAALPARGAEYISRGEWPSIQRGIQVTQYSKLANIVEEFDRAPGSDIVILHPGGEAGHGWALEIRDWLVALGIPSGTIALRPGSDVPGSIGLHVETREDRP